MAKKLKGDYFYLTANDLISGNVLYLSNNKWSKYFDDAIKIKRNEIETYEKIALEDEKKCIIISPFFVELTDEGKLENSGIKLERMV